MFNHVGVMGRLAQDPELRRTQSGTAVASFTLAVERDVKDKNDERVTDWVDCVAWRGTAEFIARNFRKGQSALVSGRLQTRDWTYKDGNKRRSAEVLVDEVYFSGPRRNGDSGPSGASPAGFPRSAPASGPCSAIAGASHGELLDGFTAVNDEDAGELPF